MRTNFLGGSARFPKTPMPEYESVRQYEQSYRNLNQHQSGDPVKAARALIGLAASANPPARIYLGADSLNAIERKLMEVAQEVSEYRDMSLSTRFDH